MERTNPAVTVIKVTGTFTLLLTVELTWSFLFIV